MTNYCKKTSLAMAFYLSFCLKLCADQAIPTSNLAIQYQSFVWLLPILLLSLLIYVLIRRFLPTKMELLLKEVITCSEYAIAVLDDKGNVIYMNRKTRQLFNTGANVVLPIALQVVAPFGQDHTFVDAIMKLIDNKSGVQSSPFIFTTDFKYTTDGGGGVYLVSLRSYSSRLLNKTAYMLAMIEADPKFILTESLQNALVEAEQNIEELKNIDKLKSEFLAICSHELKTPLASMMGYLNLMSAEKLGGLSEQQKKALKVSLRNVSQLDALITSMLNFARMEAGKLDFYFTSTDINLLIIDAIDTLKPIADEKKITVNFEKISLARKVSADYGLMHRVLLNLLGNSIKFSDEGSRIIVSIDDSDKTKVVITIQDFGSGIPAAKIQEIKMPFVQIKREDTGSRRGLGLGLAICEKILIGHGTTLQIKSEENKGTAVSFDLKAEDQTSS